MNLPTNPSSPNTVMELQVLVLNLLTVLLHISHHSREDASEFVKVAFCSKHLQILQLFLSHSNDFISHNYVYRYIHIWHLTIWEFKGFMCVPSLCALRSRACELIKMCLHIQSRHCFRLLHFSLYFIYNSPLFNHFSSPWPSQRQEPKRNLTTVSVILFSFISFVSNQEHMEQPTLSLGSLQNEMLS